MSKTSEKLTELMWKIIDWNKETLPYNTKEMQWNKVEEEINEAKEAAEKDDEEQMKWEVADVWIAMAGLGRWDVTTALHCILDMSVGCPLSQEELAEYVEKKFEIVKQRTYVIENGVYRHPKVN